MLTPAFFQPTRRTPKPFLAVAAVLLVGLLLTALLTGWIELHAHDIVKAGYVRLWPEAEVLVLQRMKQGDADLHSLAQRLIAVGEHPGASLALQATLTGALEALPNPLWSEVGWATVHDGAVGGKLRVRARWWQDGEGRTANALERDSTDAELLARLGETLSGLPAGELLGISPALSPNFLPLGTKEARRGLPSQRVQVLSMRAGGPDGLGGAVLYAVLDLDRLAETLTAGGGNRFSGIMLLDATSGTPQGTEPYYDFTVPAGGREWTLRLMAKPALLHVYSRLLTVPILTMGSLLSVAAATVTWRLLRRRIQAEQEREELRELALSRETQRMDRALQRRDALLQLRRGQGLDLAPQLPQVLATASALLGEAQAQYWRLGEEGRSLLLQGEHPLTARGQAAVILSEDTSAEDFAVWRRTPEVRNLDEKGGVQAREPGLTQVVAATQVAVGDRLARGLDAPIWLDGRLVGLLRIEHVVGVRTWTVEEMETLKTIAQHLALVLATAANRRANAELAEALAQARELNELKSRVVSFVSHELRTPLAVIQSSADLLATYHAQLSPERREQQLGHIKEAVTRMNGLVEQVLSLQYGGAQRRRFTPEPLVIEGLLQRLKRDSELAGRGRCPIELVMEGDFTGVQADPKLLQPLLNNLLSNAIKYSPPGTPVELRASRTDNAVVLTVADRGIGIPSEDRAGLFNEFHRARNIGSAPGFGLGLAIVKRCVEEHGGTIRLEPRPGGGTVAEVTLPLQPPTPRS